MKIGQCRKGRGLSSEKRWGCFPLPVPSGLIGSVDAIRGETKKPFVSSEKKKRQGMDPSNFSSLKKKEQIRQGPSTGRTREGI